MADDACVAEVAEFLNAEFGGDISKLQNAEKVLEGIIKTEEELNSKLPPSSDEPAQYATFHKSAKNSLLKITQLQQRYAVLQKSAESQYDIAQPVKENFASHLDSVRQLEKAYNYLQWLSFIEHKNGLMEEVVKQGISSEMIAHFSVFKETWAKLKSSSCINLFAYSENIMLYWYNILKQKFENEFQKVLSSLHWPLLLTSAPGSLKKTPDIISKFSYLFKTLYDIQLPDDDKNSSEHSNISRQRFLLPLELMFEPLRKRFIFHFMSKKQTNRIDKPEWYLAQILTWISDHGPFMNEVVQPLLDQKGSSPVNAFDELMRFLVQLAVMRLQKDLPVLLTEDILLSHTIDEIFLFENELKNQGYPMFYPSILQVLITEPCFTRWKALEHKSALDKMDRLLNSETAWLSCYQDEENLDDLKIPECAEVFITLLLTMTERYKHLPEEKQQLCFMELQLELLDDFRLRLHQLSQYEVEETLNPKYCAIVNALNYVVMVLNEWSNLPFFLKLYACLQKKKRTVIPSVAKSRKFSKGEEKEEVLDGSVFDEAVVLLEHMQKDLLNNLYERVMLDIKAKSRPYRKEKWFCMAAPHDRKTFEVSPLAYPLLDVINTSLQGLKDLLAKPLFTVVWQEIAKQLNEYLYEEVILQNSFNERGAEQLNFDMTRNLFPIFGMYTLKPENYFKLVKESCILLTLLPAPAMLLKETLKHDESIEEHTSALAELGVYTLKPAQAMVILSQRNDIST